MRIRVVSFTKKGGALAHRLKDVLELDIAVFERYGNENKESLSTWTGKQFQEKNALVFIGATGIAVRAIAPFVQDKLSDSPVVVIDEKGQFVIPLLSGHVGGANELAERIAIKIGATPVITTATDIHGKFAVDVFAKKQGLAIVNREGIEKVSSKILDGKKATIAIEGCGMDLELPKELEQVFYPPEKKTDIVISTAKEKIPEAVLQLRPKEYVLGIGCRKGKTFEEIHFFIKKQLETLQITEADIRAIASIDVKAREEGILQWANYYRVPFMTFSSEELQQVPGTFRGSAFVEKQVGVDNVCERAALAACEGDGKLILEKQAENGITLAVAKRKWKFVQGVEKENE